MSFDRNSAATIGLSCKTNDEQFNTENLVIKAYREHGLNWKESQSRLLKDHHIHFIIQKLYDLPTSVSSLDASQPWLVYWSIHVLNLLGYNLSSTLKLNIIQLLKMCESKDGGYGGGPKQLPHLATTYAAINSLAILSTKEALDSINRRTMLNFLKSMKNKDGSFKMHLGGENDVRGAYCALSIARLTGILLSNPELFKNTDQWIAKCQTYEGGFGGRPSLEAHGGYTFCGLAGLAILNSTHLINLPLLLRWICERQMSIEGGFQGRTHKLVDSCYSFWQVASIPILQRILHRDGDPGFDDSEALIDTSALQKYIIYCCQKVPPLRSGLSVPNVPSKLLPESHHDVALKISGGGIVDKPGKNPDIYHTCYGLSGLSVAQRLPNIPIQVYTPCKHCNQKLEAISDGHPCSSKIQNVLGSPDNDNLLTEVHVWHNISNEAVAFTITYFDSLDMGLSSEEAFDSATQAFERVKLKTSLFS